MDGSRLDAGRCGDGKTKAFTARIVHLMNTDAPGRNEIPCRDLTNKGRARDEKNRRRDIVLGQQISRDALGGTFHAI